MKVALVAVVVAAFAILHLQGYDDDRLPIDSVTAGDRPSPVLFPDGPGFAYRMSAGQAIDSTYRLPRLKRRWTDRLNAGSYYLHGAVEFRTDRPCASSARIEWRLNRQRDRLPLTHQVQFAALSVDRESLRLTARLDSPGPCTGTLRFRHPMVANVPPYKDGETRQSPTLETVDLSRWGGPSA
ncbi:hypothetical protein GCM10009678_19710 [Actinomadura kijaniata]|uniref:Uncharacterized protein n=1 Tax=Actinomadura namibiensis TaxID=182080 RepID=A0A7W3QQY1_ACTNM|nr:hypothetical protein [Actinomadura namibiensis]MBA8956215.1 hypothetical protein [Actinomadura namibiensis]